MEEFYQKLFPKNSPIALAQSKLGIGMMI